MTELSRRTLLSAGAAGVGVATIISSPQALAAGKARLYRRSRFVRLRRKTFRFTSATGSWPVKLTGVADLSGASFGVERSFVLTFRTASGGPPQGTYVLRRKGFGSTPLFVVPSDSSLRIYRAIVNCR